MQRRVRILAAVFATTAALWVSQSAASAGPLPCSGYGGQGAGGFVSSLVDNCLSALGH
jgi:hypothetical protein